MCRCRIRLSNGLIGTLRRECVDQLLFWSASDLEDKLVAFQDFYNAHRAHASLDGRTPVPIRKDVARLDRYRWDAHCRGLYQTPNRGVTSEQRRRWRAGRRAVVRRLSRHRRAVRQLHALLMPSRQLRGDSRLTGPEDRTMSRIPTNSPPTSRSDDDSRVPDFCLISTPWRLR